MMRVHGPYVNPATHFQEKEAVDVCSISGATCTEFKVACRGCGPEVSGHRAHCSQSVACSIVWSISGMNTVLPRFSLLSAKSGLSPLDPSGPGAYVTNLYGIQMCSHCNESQYLPVHCICSVTLSNHTMVLSGFRCIHTYTGT